MLPLSLEFLLVGVLVFWRDCICELEFSLAAFNILWFWHFNDNVSWINVFFLFRFLAGLFGSLTVSDTFLWIIGYFSVIILFISFSILLVWSHFLLLSLRFGLFIISLNSYLLSLCLCFLSWCLNEIFKFVLHSSMQINIDSIEISLKCPQKFKNRMTIWPR